MPVPPSRGKLPLKGIYRDTLLRKSPDGFTPDVMNMVVNKITATFNTEPGNVLVSNIATANNLTIIGIKDILHGGKIIFSINNNTSLSEIGLLDSNYTYTAVIQEDLGFDINFPFAPSNMQVEYDFQGNLIVAFTDNLNTPKIVNLTNPPSPFNISEIQLFPSFLNPICVSTVLENGGSLPAGTYFPAFRYQNNDGTSTSYGAVNNPVYIVPSNGATFDGYQGSIGGASTTKSIQFTLTNVDTNYDRVVLGIAYYSNGQLSVFEVSQTNTGSTVIITYSGSEQVTDISLEAITVPPAFYDRIGHLTQVQGTLYGADVSEAQPINLQKWANLIELQFQSTLLNANTLQTSYKVYPQNNGMKCFAHQEVYAFYLIAKLKSGGWTQAAVIPGRVATTIQGSITGNETDLCSSLVGQDPTMSTDITVDPNAKYFQTRDTTRDLNTGTFTGTFGYWENEDEVYPTTSDFDSSGIGGEDLRGTPVRHFRFPSITKCRTGFYSGNTQYGLDHLDTLSVIVSSFPTIDSDILDQIEGFQIMYAQRSYANQLVLGNDLILNGARREGDNPTNVDLNTIYTSSGNWENHDLSPVPSVNNDENIIPYQKWLRLHSFNLLLNKPAVNPAYLTNHFILGSSNMAADHLLASDTVNYGYEIFYPVNTDAVASNLSNNDERMFAIDSWRYVPNNVLDGQICNYNAEAFIHARLIAGNNRTVYGDNGMFLEDASQVPVLNNDQCYFCSIMNYRKNIYSSFYNQNLAATGFYWTVGSSIPVIWGGDTFISIYSFVTFSPRTLRDIPGTQHPYSGPVSQFAGVKVVRAYVCEASDNIGFRYEAPGDATTKYWPQETVIAGNFWFSNLAVSQDPNNIQYDKDFSMVNSINPFLPTNPYAIFEADHPYRIIRSSITPSDEQTLSWRTFLANDFYELRKDRGLITNIQGINYDLLINLETTILQTVANQVINIGTSTAGASTEGTATAYVGTGDIFQRVPTELRTDKEGYGGCQHRFSCLLTPKGYFFADVDAHKVFLVNEGKLSEITYGLYQYFLDNLSSTGDNPYLNTGLTVAYDSQYERIIFSQLDISPFNWNFTPEKETWTSRSIYQPLLLFNDRTGFYSLDSSFNMWKHNASNKANFYGTIYPSWVVTVERVLPPKRDPYEPRDPQATSIDQLWFSINWKTEVLLNGVKLKDKTVDQILIWDSYQSSGNINVQPFQSFETLQANRGYNARRIKDRWIYNKMRDDVVDVTQPFIDDYSSIEGNINHNKNFDLRKRFADDFLAIKFLFTNEIINTFQPDNFLTDSEAEHQVITR